MPGYFSARGSGVVQRARSPSWQASCRSRNSHYVQELLRAHQSRRAHCKDSHFSPSFPQRTPCSRNPQPGPSRRTSRKKNHPPRNVRQHCYIRFEADFMPFSGFFVQRNGRRGLHIRLAAQQSNKDMKNGGWIAPAAVFMCCSDLIICTVRTRCP